MRNEKPYRASDIHCGYYAGGGIFIRDTYLPFLQYNYQFFTFGKPLRFWVAEVELCKTV